MTIYEELQRNINSTIALYDRDATQLEKLPELMWKQISAQLGVPDASVRIGAIGPQGNFLAVAPKADWGRINFLVEIDFPLAEAKKRTFVFKVSSKIEWPNYTIAIGNDRFDVTFDPQIHTPDLAKAVTKIGTELKQEVKVFLAN